MDKDNDKDLASKNKLKELFEEMPGKNENHVASTFLKKVVIREKKMKTITLGNIEASIQEFKMTEAFLESFPQVVLQTCAIIHKDASDPSFLSIMEDEKLTLTVLTSLVSVVASVTSAFMKMPHISGEQKVPINQYWKNYLMVAFLMFLVVTPRLIWISTFFACCRHGISVAFLAIALITYAIPYWSYVYANFKNCGKETWKLIIVNFFTSMIGPCIVIDPKSSLIFVSFLFSMVGHLVLLGTLQMSSILWPHLVILSMNQMVPFIRSFMMMIPIIIFTSLCSYPQLEEKKQLFAKKIGLGSVCCEEKDEMKWALERSYHKVTKDLFDNGCELDFKKLDFDFIEADKLGFLFRYACDRGWHGVVMKLLMHPENEDFILTKGDKKETGFMLACKGGWMNIVEQLLKHPLSREIVVQKDEEGRTGILYASLFKKEDVVIALLKNSDNEEMLNMIFGPACSDGMIKLVKLILEHQNNPEIFSFKDNKGKTAFIHACYGGRIEIVQMILDRQSNQEILALKDNEGKTGFIHAHLTHREEVVSLLLSHPCNEDMLNSSFHFACDSGLIKVVECLKDLPTREEIIASTDENGENGFQKACRSGHHDIVDLLMMLPKMQEIIASKDDNGENGFQKACSSGNHSIVDLFLMLPNRQEIISSRDHQGESGFVKACNMRKTHIIKSLVMVVESDDLYSGYQKVCLNYVIGKTKEKNQTKLNENTLIIEFFLTPPSDDGELMVKLCDKEKKVTFCCFLSF